MSRNLVTIRTVNEIHEIQGADLIELLVIDGWQVVCNKNYGIKKGERILFFEVDSFLPETDSRFSFMAGRGIQTNGDGSKGYRLRTVKLRKTLSQGLALPLDIFPELYSAQDDIASEIGVTKYEPAIPAQLSGQAKGTFPAFLKKTDEERIQNMPWILEDKGMWEATQKLNGSSMTVFWNGGDFGVCSRKLELKETEGNSFWDVAKQYSMREKLNDLGENVALQGELVGPSIQGNQHGLSKPDFYLFNIWLIDFSRYATPDERFAMLMEPALEGIKTVPVIHHEMSLDRFDSVDDILQFADQVRDKLNPNNATPEGVVFKKLDGSQSFKVISNKYLMAEK